MEQVINRWADVIAKESGIHRDIIVYGIKVFFNQLFGVLAVLVTAAIFDCLLTTFVASFTAMAIKIFAGGRHASNPIICYLGSALVFVGIGLASPMLTIVNNHSSIAVLVVALLGLPILIIYAPVDTPHKPIKQERRQVLRRLAIISWVICSMLLLFFSVQTFFFVEYSLITASLLGMLVTVFGLITWRKEVIS